MEEEYHRTKVDSDP
ncbi:hypothetical protein A2U01_0080717, partial [Trifolium medium]|nr:hypothetical protein [Trifolium medium]